MSDNHIGAATLLDGIDLARDDPQIVQTIVYILKAHDYPQLFSTFHGENPQSSPEKAVKFVNVLNKACVPPPPCLVCNAELTLPVHLQALGYDDVLPDTKNKIRRVLRKTCAEAGILPTSYYLDDKQLKKLNDVPFASGRSSDVWRGSYKGEDVSIKAFRVYTTDNIKHLTKVLSVFTMIVRKITNRVQLASGMVQGDCGLPKPLPP